RNALVYIFDEPIGGVDPAAREVILDIILNNYSEDSLVLISTHLITDIEKIFDEVVFLKEGEVVLHRNTEELRSETGKSVDELFREVFKC
ncbi:MAG: ABC transporter ATP-binding protein, partial [Erysipelotrichaceae bacterium]|nr:ABC transporter ATP-binding protein [Erysipelotrichaceae bacterium]